MPYRTNTCHIDSSVFWSYIRYPAKKLIPAQHLAKEGHYQTRQLLNNGCYQERIPRCISKTNFVSVPYETGKSLG